MRLNSDKDKNIEKYLSPIINSKLIYDTIKEVKYSIQITDANELYSVETNVINESDVYNLIIKTQIEASVLIIEKLMEDELVVMSDDLEKSFRKYIDTIKPKLESEEFIKHKKV